MGASLGVESNKSSSKTTGTSTDTLDPRLSGELYGNVADTKALGSYTPYSGPMVAGFNQDQLNAQDQGRALSGANVGGGLLNQAAQAAGGASSYVPQTIMGGGYTPGQASAATIDRSKIGNVGYSDIGAADIARFQNPFENTVVQNSLNDLQRQQQIAQANNNSFATKAGAFRGSGLFNLRDRTDETYARQAGDTAGNLRYQGFNTALGAAQTDAARRTQVESQNQGADLSVAGQNAGNQQQANLFNAGATNDANRYKADQGYNAQVANNTFGQGAQQTNLAGAGLLGNIAGQQRSNAYQDVGLLGSIGDAIQSNDQAKIDALYGEYQKQYGSTLDKQGLINAALGLIPKTGTVSSSGTETGKSSGVSAGVAAKYPGGGK